ncbi:MAG: hypothetical protein ABJH68_06645 [Ilumatobacter sp.]|uniref:hypothetical protein n=1 Tax=Ilumatobacter sp. TaxID=1967498 RepID=UPI003299B1BD
MFFWFFATSVVTIGFVFRDPTFDNRLLLVGSVLPAVDAVFGGARALHSVTVSIVMLAVVMIATKRGSGRRKTLLGLPIGLFLHLVFDAAWNDTDTFWWPFTGFGFDDRGIPIVDRGWISVGLELVGIAGCVWLWRRNGMGDPTRRRRFLHDGRLDAVPDRTP